MNIEIVFNHRGDYVLRRECTDPHHYHATYQDGANRFHKFLHWAGGEYGWFHSDANDPYVKRFTSLEAAQSEVVDILLIS